MGGKQRYHTVPGQMGTGHRAAKATAVRRHPFAPFPLPNTARGVLRRGLLKVGPDAKRRQDAWNWIASLEAGGAASWERKPVQLSETHWHDLQAGACFFALREAAITVLDELESHMGTMASPSLDLSDLSKDWPCDLEPLMLAAQQYLTVVREGRDEDKDALVFAEECCGDDIVRALVRRDGQVPVSYTHLRAHET